MFRGCQNVLVKKKQCVLPQLRSSKNSRGLVRKESSWCRLVERPSSLAATNVERANGPLESSRRDIEINLGAGLAAATGISLENVLASTEKDKTYSTTVTLTMPLSPLRVITLPQRSSESKSAAGMAATMLLSPLSLPQAPRPGW